MQGSATAPPEALRSLGSFDVALSGWGTTSAIPDLRPGEGRQARFLAELCRRAPRLLNVVSSENNFLGPQARFRELRRRRAAAVGEEAAFLHLHEEVAQRVRGRRHARRGDRRLSTRHGRAPGEGEGGEEGRE